MAGRIEIVNESVVFQETDAIVNAANATMLGGGAVDGAIHDAAGPELYEFFNAKCKMWKAGDVEISPGFGCNAKFICHAVGPIWNGGKNGEPEMLKKCYVGCLEKAAESGCKSIAFCCISTGVYRYPLEDATRIALSTVSKWLQEHELEMLVRFCCYNSKEFNVYRKVAYELGICYSSPPIDDET